MRLDLESLVSGCEDTLTDKEAKILAACFEYAYESVGGIVRKTGGSYFRHPWNVARILAERQVNALIICAALNHDTLEELADGATDLPGAIKKEAKKFKDYLTKKLQSKEPGAPDYTKEIKFVVDLVKAVTNTNKKDYIGYLRSIFAIKGKRLREGAIMIKAADDIDNIVDIGTQERFTSGGNLRSDILNVYWRLREKASRTMRNLEEYKPEHYLAMAKALPSKLASLLWNSAKSAIRNGIFSVPSTLYLDFGAWANYPGFPGHEIAKRGFKNLCFLSLYKEYLKKEGMLTPDPYEYDELDNVHFFYRRLGKVTERILEGLTSRIYGIGMRHGNREMKAGLDEVRWQLGHEEFGFKTLDRRTHKTEGHQIHPPTERKSSSYARAGSIEELEEGYSLLRPTTRLKKSVREIFHGVVDKYLRAFADKRELHDMADDLITQYAHAKASCEIIKKIRNDFDYQLEMC